MFPFLLNEMTSPKQFCIKDLIREKRVNAHSIQDPPRCFRRDYVPIFSPRFPATRPSEQVPEREQESDDETLRRSSDL